MIIYDGVKLVSGSLNPNQAANLDKLSKKLTTLISSEIAKIFANELAKINKPEPDSQDEETPKPVVPTTTLPTETV